MMFSQQGLFAFSLYLLVQLCSAEDPNVFDIEAEVEKFVKEEAKKMNTHVTWWDTKGEHSELRQGGGKYEKFKVTSSPGGLELGEVLKTYVRSTTLYTQMVHNDQSKPSEVLLKRNVKHQRTTTWSIEKSFKVRNGAEMKFHIPTDSIKVSVGATLDLTDESKPGTSLTTTDTEDFVVEKRIVVAPKTSLTVRWIVKDHTQDMKWTASITSKGWFAVRFANQGGEPFFYPVCKLSPVSATSNCDTQNMDGGSVKFTATGVVSAVKNSEITLRVEEHDLKSFGSEP